MKKLMQNPAVRFIKQYFLITLGAAIYGYTASRIFAPNNILSGGATGVAIVLNRLFNLPIGIMILVINLPLFALGFIFIGKRFTFSTLYATAVLSVSADLFAFLKQPVDDVLLAAVFGGLAAGVGLALVFTQGSTTGGTDIIVRLIRKKNNHMPMGRILLAVDAVIIGAGALVLQNVNSALYAVIGMYVCSVAIDGLLYGVDYAKAAYVISDRAEETARALLSGLGRGVTMLYGRGVYTGNEKQVLLCAIKRQQIGMLKEIVNKTDPNAFVIVTEAREVLGQGFAEHGKGY